MFVGLFKLHWSHLVFLPRNGTGFVAAGSLDSAYAEALQVHVAKLVTTPAVGADGDAYLGNIAGQTLQLLLYGLFKNDKVCVLIVFLPCVATDTYVGSHSSTLIEASAKSPCFPPVT